MRNTCKVFLSKMLALALVIHQVSLYPKTADLAASASNTYLRVWKILIRASSKVHPVMNPAQSSR